MTRLTADTITDEQIRDLQYAVNTCTEMACSTCHATWQATRIALHDEPHAADYPTSEHRLAARARCAEILNARAKERR